MKFCSKKPQIQEGLGREIGELLVAAVKPLYVKVTIYDTVHTCVLSRGVESEANTETVWEWYK